MHPPILEARADVGLLVLLVIVVLTILIPFAMATTAKLEKAWREVSANLALAKEKGLVLTGRCQQSDVVVRGLGGKHSSTVIELTDGLPTDVEFWREGMWSLTDPEIGDPAFDRSVRVRGDCVDVLVACDAPLRGALRAAAAEGWTLREGVLKGTFSGILTDHLEAKIRDGLGLAQQLREVDEARAAHLGRRVHDDPSPGVRHGALRALASGRYGRPALDAALPRGLDDVDDDNRFYAAELAEHVPTFLALAKEGHAPALRALIARPHAHEALRPVLAGWLTQIPLERPATAVALADALAVVPVDGAEDALVGMLASYEEVPLAAARALAAVGSIHAVPALAPLRDRVLGGELKSAARDAILAIQARAAGAEVGALALASASAGGLALTPTAETETETGT